MSPLSGCGPHAGTQVTQFAKEVLWGACTSCASCLCRVNLPRTLGSLPRKAPAAVGNHGLHAFCPMGSWGPLSLCTKSACFVRLQARALLLHLGQVGPCPVVSLGRWGLRSPRTWSALSTSSFVPKSRGWHSTVLLLPTCPCISQPAEFFLEGSRGPPWALSWSSVGVLSIVLAFGIAQGASKLLLASREVTSSQAEQGDGRTGQTRVEGARLGRGA